MRLTLRTLLAYLDDTLPAAEAADLGRKLAANPDAQRLVDRIRTVTRRRGIAAPTSTADRTPADPNAAAEYLSDALPADETAAFEAACLADDAYLAEVSACHQVLTLVLSEQVRVPPTARTRMYKLVKGRESVPGRRPAANLSVATVREAAAADDDHDADANLLLGLPAYSATESSERRIARYATAAGLLAGFAVCAFMAWPASSTADTDRGAVVLNTPTPAPTPPTFATVAPAKPPGELAPPAVAPVEPAPGPAGELAPAPAPVQPAQPPTEPAKVDPPKAEPPKGDRLPVGRFDRPAGGAAGLLVRRPAGGAVWERVPTEPNGVLAGDRLVCLPGYRAAVRLDSGATADLWGNLPELAPLPLLAASVTPALPPDGFHADLLVHTGRVYLGSKQPTGSKVRLRFGKEVWDVTLPDDKSEAVFELLHRPDPAGPAASARLVTLNGPVTVTPAGEQPVKLERYAGLGWAAEAGGKAQPLPPLSRQDREPLAKLSSYPPGAQPVLAALTDLSRRAANAPKVEATLDELVQATPTGKADAAGVFAGVRVGVYGLAALGQVDRLVDLLTGTASPAARQTAAEALVPALAAEPGLADQVRQTLTGQKMLTPAEADEAVRLLRGLSPAERADPAALDRLVADLQSTALPLRELALMSLIGLADPAERPRVTVPPFVFDTAGAEADREAGTQAWKRRVEEWKKKAVAPPAKK
jgi:hypothetical protein